MNFALFFIWARVYSHLSPFLLPLKILFGGGELIMLPKLLQ